LIKLKLNISILTPVFQNGPSDERPRIARNSVVSRHNSTSDRDLNELRAYQLTNRSARKIPYVDKPSGYSLFAYELFPAPKSWAEQTCNLVSYNQHAKGGHFAVRIILVAASVA
jgi:hypothetical protein